MWTITTEIITPKYDSRLIFDNKKIIAATSVAREINASNLASSPEAMRLSDSVKTPILFTQLPSINFTATATTIINKDIKSYVGSDGLKIFFTDTINDVMPAYRTITDINTADKFSIRPCPSGCSLSGFLKANLVAIIVI